MVGIGTEKKNPDAQYLLAWCYYDGSGIKKNKEDSI